MVVVLIGSVIILQIVAVHDTIRTLRIILYRRTAEYRLRGLCHIRVSTDPTVLHISITLLGYTCTSEGSGDTEVIDRTAEFAKERIVQTANGMSIAVEDATEARIVIPCIFSNRCP